MEKDFKKAENEWDLNLYKMEIYKKSLKYSKEESTTSVDIMNNWISFEEEIKSFVDIVMIKDNLNPLFEESFREELLKYGKELHLAKFPS